VISFIGVWLWQTIGKTSAELFRIVNSKLDTVIATQAAVDSRLENLEKQAGETTRTLRGFNGTPGLVTQVAVLESTVKAVPCIKAGHPPCEDNAKAAHQAAPNSQGDGGRGASSTYVSWQWAAEKLIVRSWSRLWRGFCSPSCHSGFSIYPMCPKGGPSCLVLHFLS